MGIEVFVSNNMRVFVQRPKMVEHSFTADEEPLDDGVKITQVLVIVLKIATAVAHAPALVEGTLQFEKRLADLFCINRHLMPFPIIYRLAIIGHQCAKEGEIRHISGVNRTLI